MKNKGYAVQIQSARSDRRVSDVALDREEKYFTLFEQASDGKHTYDFVLQAIVRDITERKYTEKLLEAQKQSLEMLVRGRPLAEVLAHLTFVVEEQAEENAIASILLLDKEGFLRNGASPSLPEAYISAIDGLKARATLGTCGVAAALGTIVITKDIESDPNWRTIKHLPLALGLKAAWSLPIKARNGRVLGTFGTYFCECRGPTPRERQVVEILARTAALAIERMHSDTALRESEEALRQARDELEKRVYERTADLIGTNRSLQTEISERKRAQEAHQQLLAQLVTTQEDERRRLSRELHDQMGQHLTAIMLLVDSLKRVPELEPVNSTFRQLEEVAGQLSDQVESLAWELRPAALDDLGLDAALGKYVRKWSERSLIAVDLQITGRNGSRMPAAIETAIYRIVQETLTNVLKHSRAHSVALILERRPNHVSAIIEDNGCGFAAETLQANIAAERRMGFLGMQERAALVGGTLHIESAVGTGTTVYLRIPLVAGENGEG